MTVRLLHGDCRQVLRTLPDASVHCCVTSPPYFGLRDYGVVGQLGLEPTPAEYVAQMVDVFREVRRVLRDDGTLFLNIGDSYFSSGGATPGKRSQGIGQAGVSQGLRRVTSRRAGACGTSGTAPANSTASGCLCGSLCDACRRAYRFGKSHTDGLRAPMPAPSQSASSRVHTESESCRLPTSDSTVPAGRSEGAILPAQQVQGRATAQLPGALESMTAGSSRQHPEGSPLSAQPSECQLCGCSFERCALESSDSSACTCGIGSRSGASVDCTTGTVSSGLAYPYSTTTALKSKDLIGIPWRVAFALQADGWYLRQDIIWHKPNPMPESVRDRCTKAHEYVFLLSKSERYWWDAEAMRERAVAADIGAMDGGAQRQADGTDANEGRNFRSKADSFKRDASKRAAAIHGQSVGTHRAEREESAYDTFTRNKRSVWTIATQPFAEAHFATMAPELAETCIKAGCPAGGTVLDPFGGAGTTGLVADRLQRAAILIELNPAYAALATERITGDAPLFAEVA